MSNAQLEQIDLNNSYELSLSSTLWINVAASLALLFVFPLLQLLSGSVYEPELYEHREETGVWRSIFWYVDVLLEPLSVYCQRGNMTYMYVVFQRKMFLLLLVIALISLVFLMPTYYQGTDQSFNIRYLTVWSQMNMSHIEEGSSQMWVPILASIAIPIVIIQFYRDFVKFYAEYRQLCSKRIIPENYVVMLTNIPKNISTQSELETALESISEGIMKIITIPKESRQLVYLKTQETKYEEELEQYYYDYERTDAQILQALCKKKPNNAEQLKTKLGKLDEQAQKTLQNLNIVKSKITEISTAQEYYEYAHKMCNLPVVTEELFSSAEPELPCEQASNSNALIGNTVLLLCDSEQQAAYKANILLQNNEFVPEIVQAPSENDMVWENVESTKQQNKNRNIIFWIALMALFLVYFFVQAIIVNYISSSAEQWTVSINSAICIPICKGTKCLCNQLIQTMITYIPTLVNCLLMSLLPYAIELCIQLLPLYSKEEQSQYLYRILFIFLILIEGIIQVALPSTISPETGKIDLHFVATMSISDFLLSLGRNLPNSTFVFINYIIGKYYLFPMFSILNFGQLILALLLRCNTHCKINYPAKMEGQVFNYGKQLAYINHMFTISLIFTLISPFTNVVVVVTYLVMIITDRYELLYVIKPSPLNDLSPESTLLKNVASNVYLGLFFLQISTLAFWMLFDGWMYSLGKVLQVLMFIFAFIEKYSIDHRYARSLTEMSVGNFHEFDEEEVSQKNNIISRSIQRFEIPEIQVSFCNSNNRSVVLPNDQVKYYKISEKDAQCICYSYEHPALK